MAANVCGQPVRSKPVRRPGVPGTGASARRFAGNAGSTGSLDMARILTLSDRVAGWTVDEAEFGTRA
ncbi:hypothetical protein WI73_20395 [Burkholderia ubonensis]|uniref:hypothetical protein n=1 Tax=Burkholderia ubonensis TaxID=101571 RepID=UPI000757D773|nr:hypothetical protein [Burkholderia ubonensis]AOI68179.1 hypothetical protein WI31_00895 [Burkholderia ubonensis]KUZ52478.1 hypothetical protein WI33_12270 [Burkholderia ubonensis]KUZ73289.1 hypothetical protein WI36_16195 [Burkholderia ubonensis]KVC55886.1 hypothetical protein WI72_02870 [Burkholderia ubonensis]KVC65830.1 hypothetical protein WI73_20395 [Burkholderia ubonensis]